MTDVTVSVYSTNSGYT